MLVEATGGQNPAYKEDLLFFSLFSLFRKLAWTVLDKRNRSVYPYDKFERYRILLRRRGDADKGEKMKRQKARDYDPAKDGGVFLCLPGRKTGDGLGRSQAQRAQILASIIGVA